MYTYPEIISKISNLYVVLVYKGRGSNMMKMTAKRRRTKQEVKDEKRDEERKRGEVNAKLAVFEELKK